MKKQKLSSRGINFPYDGQPNWEDLLVFVNSGKCIVLANEHNVNTEYYDISSQEKLETTLLSILFDISDWFTDGLLPDPPLISQKMIDGLPEGRVKDVAIEELKLYSEEMKTYEREVWLRTTVKQALREQNARLAYVCLLKVFPDTHGTYSMRVIFPRVIKKKSTKKRKRTKNVS